MHTEKFQGKIRWQLFCGKVLKPLWDRRGCVASRAFMKAKEAGEKSFVCFVPFSHFSSQDDEDGKGKKQLLLIAFDDGGKIFLVPNAVENSISTFVSPYFWVVHHKEMSPRPPLFLSLDWRKKRKNAFFFMVIFYILFCFEDLKAAPFFFPEKKKLIFFCPRHCLYCTRLLALFPIQQCEIMEGGIFSAAALISPANLANGQRKEEERRKTLSQKNANMGGGKVSIKCGKSWCICARAFLKSPLFLQVRAIKRVSWREKKTLLFA